jgi:galactonate dehydratase
MNATAELDWIGTPKAVRRGAWTRHGAQGAGMDVGPRFPRPRPQADGKQLAKVLEPLGLLFIEEPLLSENLEGLAQIASLVSTPIALGERLYSRWDFKPFFESRSVDIIQPDLSHAGGLLECRKIAAMAEAMTSPSRPHLPARARWRSPPACSSRPARPTSPIQEMSLGIHYNVGHDLLEFVTDKAVLTPVDGHLPIPTAPGLGITIDEDAVREAHKTGHRWRNPIWRQKDGSFAEW